MDASERIAGSPLDTRASRPKRPLPNPKIGENSGILRVKSRKTGKTRKKPVETEEIELTKRWKRLKVNGGTVSPNPHEH
jgi:hypothetical protein